MRKCLKVCLLLFVGAKPISNQCLFMIYRDTFMNNRIRFLRSERRTGKPNNAKNLLNLLKIGFHPSRLEFKFIGIGPDRRLQLVWARIYTALCGMRAKGTVWHSSASSYTKSGRSESENIECIHRDSQRVFDKIQPTVVYESGESVWVLVVNVTGSNWTGA